METIRIEKPDDAMAGTTIVMAAMEILEEAGIQNPGSLEMDNTGGTEIIISGISAEVARVLRIGLPKKGYKIVDESRDPWPEPPPSIH